MLRIRRYSASVTYRNELGKMQEDEFAVNHSDHASASRIAFAYVLQVLKLNEFELRIVGA